jgi:CheY-like chemotaxis protein
VLVVEDMLLMADAMTEALEDLGCIVVGPAPRLARGLALAQAEALDGALLDVNLAGEFCFPIAVALQGRGIPFVFVTGYSDVVALPPAFQTTPRLGKPFTGAMLAAVMSQAFQHPG